MTQYGFYFDNARCTGCRTCEMACKDWPLPWASGVGRYAASVFTHPPSSTLSPSIFGLCQVPCGTAMVPGMMRLVTFGGILTDADQNAVDANYDPIPGLYVSGNDCGRRFGYEYITPIPGIGS